MGIAAVPSTYAGYQMRSRLEARWAAMFDAVGWRWEYEPADCAGYSPDFLIHGVHPVLVEVRPAVTYEDYKTQATSVLTRLGGQWTGDVLVVGVSPVMGGLVHLGLGFTAQDPHPSGRQRRREVEFFDWSWCTPCSAVRVNTRYADPTHRQCGHRPTDSAEVAPWRVRYDWAQACNRVRWVPGGRHRRETGRSG